MKVLYILISIIIGGLLGYLYWQFIGCSTGTCAITSIWWRSTLYGMLIGALLSKEIGGFVQKIIG
jgi:hypothetical protein